jgi:hypothetical protein
VAVSGRRVWYLAPMSHAVARRPAPGFRPPAGHPLRLAFVGQATFFEACAMQGATARLQARFIEFRSGSNAHGLMSQLEEFAPHVVLVFRPEIIPAGTFRGLAARTIGFLTEPLPRGAEGAHSDLQRRLAELAHVDRSNFDRIISFDPLIAETAAEVLPVWRSLCLPVADRFYAPVAPISDHPRMLFVGRSTPHREQLLTPIKHLYDVLHVAFGVGAQRLVDLFAEHDVGINIHNEPYPSFENRVSLHLAAGHLVLSEPLSPTHGLEPGIDFIEFSGAAELTHLAERLRRFPRLWHSVRVRGRMKAELYRASRVYPRLVEDLLSDVEAFGTPRQD